MIDYINPNDIEKRSFEIIQSELPHPIDPILAPIIKRVIHTTADFEYVDSLAFSENVVEKAVMALTQGVHIVSDTNMVKAGVNKKSLQAFGSEVHCFMQEDRKSVV